MFNFDCYYHSKSVYHEKINGSHPKNVGTQGLPLPISKRKITFGISCPRALKLCETQNTQNSQLGGNHVAIPNSRVTLKVPSPSSLDIDHLQVWLLIIHIFSRWYILLRYPLCIFRFYPTLVVSY